VNNDQEKPMGISCPGTGMADVFLITGRSFAGHVEYFKTAGGINCRCIHLPLILTCIMVKVLKLRVVKNSKIPEEKYLMATQWNSKIKTWIETRSGMRSG